MKHDTAAVAAWRQRMIQPEIKMRYRQRARWIEWVKAGWRNRGWQQVNVRGLAKVRAVARWQMMAHNATRILATEALATMSALPQRSPA